MTRRHVTAAALLAAAGLFAASAPAFAQKMYKWTDKDGKIHYSNVSPESDAATVESDASPAGVEARSPETPQSAGAVVPAEGGTAEVPVEVRRAPATDSGEAVTDELFSNRASAARMRLRRELATAKEQAQEVAEKLQAVQNERSKPPSLGIDTLLASHSDKEQQASSAEEALRSEKAKADKKVESIRQEYADLHADAVKRLGREPSWWLPLD